jgi:hypothetical protein
VKKEAPLLQHLDLVPDAEYAALQDFPPYSTTQSRGKEASQARLYFIHTFARSRLPPYGEPASANLETTTYSGGEVDALDEYVGTPGIPWEVYTKFVEDLLPLPSVQERYLAQASTPIVLHDPLLEGHLDLLLLLHWRPTGVADGNAFNDA